MGFMDNIQYDLQTFGCCSRNHATTMRQHPHCARKDGKLSVDANQHQFK